MQTRFRLRLAALLAVFVLLAGPARAADEPGPIRGQGYRLIKDWDFGRTIGSVDALHREFHTRFVYNNGREDHLAGNKEWQRYRDNDNHRIEGDVLLLVAHARGGLVNGGIESGMLRSKWTGTYGYYEVRMKVPPGRGLWPAFWLNPEDAVWPPEIDVVEIVNNGRDTTMNSFHNVHPGRWKSEATFSKLDRWGSYRPGNDYKDGFHVFAVEWTASRVSHFVDGEKVAERSFDWRHDDGRDAGPAHVLLNLAVGGEWPGAPERLQDFPAVLAVDWVRVWQK